MDIKNLKKEIIEQTRNGRKEVYVKLEDLKELDEHLAGEYGDNRIFLEADYLKELIDKYEKNQFKNSLKVNINTQLEKVDNEGYHFKEIKNSDRHDKIISACKEVKKNSNMMTNQGISNCNFPEMDSEEEKETRDFLKRLDNDELYR